MGRGGGGSDNGNQREGEWGIIQGKNNYHTIALFFKER